MIIFRPIFNHLLILVALIQPAILSGSDDQVLSFSDYLDSLILEYQMEWTNSWEDALSSDHMPAHLDSLRQMFIERVGPFPPDCDLDPQVTGRVMREGYSVEKIIFESRPSFYITALLFLPDPELFKAPYPGVLVPSGHSDPGKGHDEYQSMGALCALYGMAALVFDPLDQGERHQMIDETGKPLNWGTRSHSMEGIKCNLLGQHLAGYFLHDGIRSLDYMLTREEIDKEKIGITGNSGGGVQTSYLFMADLRIKAAAPSCFIHSAFTQALTEMGDAEQNLYGQFRDGFDHTDYITIRAPQPLKILAATHDFFRISATWETYRYAKRYFTSLGFSERLDIMENDAGHNYNRQQREAAVQWLLRWLGGKDQEVREPLIDLLDPDEYTCTQSGEVMLLPGAKSIHDLLREELETRRVQRAEYQLTHSSEEIREKILWINGMDLKGQVPGLTSTILKESGQLGYTLKEMRVKSGEEYSFPANLFTPDDKQDTSPVLLLSEEETSYYMSDILQLLDEGRTVMSVELPGTGRLKQSTRKNLQLSVGTSWEDCNKAYLMGRSIVGFRTGDILNSAAFLSKISGRDETINLIAFGETGVPALHAAFLKPGLIGDVKISGTLYSWEDVVRENTSFNQLVNTVQDALSFYDLPDLVLMLGERAKIEDPLDARGFPGNGTQDFRKLSGKPEFRGLAGVGYGSTGLRNPEGPDWLGTLDLSWDNEVQKRGRDWSSEWFGFLESPADGAVSISISTEQELSLYINDKLEAKVEAGQERGEALLEMKKGKFYSIRMVYNHDESDASRLRMSWSWEGKENHVIPPETIWHSPKQKALMESRWRQSYE